MKRLVVCCDGTWATPDKEQAGVPVPTNVVLFHNALAEFDAAGAQQLSYYHPGVGTEGGSLERLAGGSMGAGLGKNIMSAYRWLGVTYSPGDSICLFGFSRGAYTVRSLAGMICRCGLLDLTAVPGADAVARDREFWARVKKVYSDGYRGSAEDTVSWPSDWEFHAGQSGGPVGIHFLGVWDTVGALGIPDDLALLNLLDDPRKYAFHDPRLHEEVSHARHAVALDECRGSFTPTLWRNVAAGRDVKQVWFAGCHSDVGGGYLERGLSDTALLWMIEEAQAAGLAFEPAMLQQIQPDCRGVLHNSCKGVHSLLRIQPRSVPVIDAGISAAVLHDSVLERQQRPPITQAPYRPTTLLAPGQAQTVSVYARERWNDTGIYLERGGRYQFSAEGEWVDRDLRCGPGGLTDSRFDLAGLGMLAGALWGKVELIFAGLTDNEHADFKGTKRVESMRWFALVGAIANAGGPAPDGTPDAVEIIEIGEGCTYPEPDDPVLATSGYLYCFANDSWHFYDNNRGQLSLTVKRLF